MAKKKKKKNLSAKQLLVAVIAVVIIAVALFLLIKFDVISVDELIDLINKREDIGGNGKENQGNQLNNTGIGKGTVDIENFQKGIIAHFIDVGQGECMFIEFPDDKCMMIDCGSGLSYSKAEVKADVLDYVDALGYTSITYLLLTHTDSDHADGMAEVIAHYDIDNVYLPNVTPGSERLSKYTLDANELALFDSGRVHDTSTYEKVFVNALNEEDCTVHVNEDVFNILGEGYDIVFHCFDEQELKDLSQGDKNSVSPIGILTYNDVNVVLTGDSTLLTEEDFLEDFNGRIPDCEILKVGHHGSDSSSGAPFLDAIKCEYAVISVGADNSYHHPHDSVAGENGTLATSGVERIFRTDLYGTVTVYIDENGNYNFTTEKTPAEAQAQN